MTAKFFTHFTLALSLHLPLTSFASLCASPDEVLQAWRERSRSTKSLVEPKPGDLVIIPKEFVSNQQRVAGHQKMTSSLIRMITAAEKDGVTLSIDSAFRSKSKQAELIADLKRQGLCEADIYKVIAPPDHSTHVTGHAVDFHPSNRDFSGTKAYDWLRKNAHRFGFKETFANQNSKTISWEPWHFDFTFQ